MTAAALLAAAAPAAGAQPVTYVVTSAASGTLQGTAFSDAVLTLTLTGADASVPTSPPGSFTQHTYYGLTEYLTLTTGTTTVGGVADTSASIFSGNQGGRQFLIIGGSGPGRFSGEFGGTGAYDLRTPFTTFISVDASSGGFGLSAAGLTITGLGGGAGFTATVGPAAVVPEPSTWALLGTGLLAVGGAAARRHPRRG